MKSVAEDANMLSHFLARTDLGMLDGGALQEAHGISNVDCVVLLANAVLYTAGQVFRSVIQDRISETLLISGGIGHSTSFLREAVAGHPAYHDVDTTGRAEAEILADIAVRHWGMEPTRIFTEAVSTNCGENAVQSRRTLEAAGLDARTVILVQDPTMQRRSHATFEHVWRDAAGVRFISCPTFTPSLRLAGSELLFDNDDVPGLWPMDRFLSLMLGEIPRLRDDAFGYGPRGRGFIAHVDVPQAVSDAHERLTGRFPDLITARQAG